MRPLAPWLAGLAIVLPSAVVRGLWTDRWGPGELPAAAAAKLEQLPLEIGDWQGRAVAADPAEREAARAAGFLIRRYENRVNGQNCTVFVACGRPGPLSVHTPEICYSGSGYELSGPRVRCSVDAPTSTQPSEFWVAAFEKQDVATPTELRLFWAWSAADAWQAPENPRLTFARAGVLYKLYVSRETAPGDGRLEDDLCKDFLRRLLPELEKVLLPHS